MRFSIITIAAIAGIALGQGQGGINLPTCATTCVTDATSGSKIGTCELFNIKCICENDSFLDSIACCLTERCEKADQEKAATEALNFCGISGATGLPTAVVCKTAAAASPTPTPNAGLQNMAGVGAGVLGAFAAVLL